MGYEACTHDRQAGENEGGEGRDWGGGREVRRGEKKGEERAWGERGRRGRK